ncbi:hypothetical protein KM1_222760 [Entamoeba histolytica HM-3:IMSS]|uniref:Uncharacterized protein n=1 Tax=Entamoeba histolytica HM-3:IMSS TaxID=885315 RepID=M7W6N4_ENTHI|nr:hypothetical protein KM1_222760 [Entamoeba histolytica HM-3:IMSS]
MGRLLFISILLVGLQGGGSIYSSPVSSQVFRLRILLYVSALSQSYLTQYVGGSKG